MLLFLLTTSTTSLSYISIICLSFHPPPPGSSPFALLVSFAAGNTDELLDATGVSQGLGVLHVLGDDLVQRTTDSCDGVIRHGLPYQAAGVATSSSTATAVVVVAASRQTVYQVPHGIFTCGHEGEEWQVDGSEVGQCERK